MTAKKSTATPRVPQARGARRTDVPTPAPDDVVIPKTLDLNARAAARAKAKKVGPKVKVGTVTYTLPAELRLDTLRGVFKLLNGEIDGLDTLLTDLFGKESLELPAFKELTLDDIGDLFNFVGAAYGIDLGNSEASTTS